jgi:hypothetical protein
MNTPQLLSTAPTGVVLSPSQIDVFDQCKRKWAFQYILKIRSPPHPSAVLGSAVHAHLEQWLKYAVPPPQDSRAGLIATKMLVNLPPPGTGAVEKKFFMETARGHNYNGIIDWTGLHLQRPTVIDHKTTSDWRYAKSENDLHSDTQGIIYAVAGLSGFGTEEIDLFWNYGLTGGRSDTKSVKTTVHLTLVMEKFETVIEETAAEVLALYKQRPNPLDLPPTPSACSAYGGCPHQQRCNLTAEERIRGIMATGQSMAERMKAQAEAAAGGGNGVHMPPQMPQAAPVEANTQIEMWTLPGAPAAYPGSTPGFVPPSEAVATASAPYPGVGPNPPESGILIPPPPPAEIVEAKRGRGRPPKDKPVKAELPTAEQWAFMIGVQSALNSGPQSIEVLGQAGDLALATFRAKFGGA